MNKKTGRKLYKIGQLCELLQLTHRTVRYYDQLGLLPHVKRSDGGIRLFDDSDIAIIKKIRKLQKQEFLPLEQIKKRLFHKTKSSPKLCAIVTDMGAILSHESIDKFNISVLPLTCIVGDKTFSNKNVLSPTEIWETSRKLKQCPEVVTPSTETFVKLYETLAKKGIERIYSIHTGSSFSSLPESASKAAHQVADTISVTVVNTEAIGPGLGLLVEKIGESIFQGNSIEEIDLLIKKQIPLIYQVGALNSLKYLINGSADNQNCKTQSLMMNKVVDFKPVFYIKDGTGEVTIDACCSNKDEAITHLKELLEEEVVNRGKYINRLMVTYHYLYSDAQKLHNEFKQAFPRIPVHLEEMTGPASIELGPEAISVSII